MLIPDQPNKVIKCGGRSKVKFLLVIRVPFKYKFPTAVSVFTQPRLLSIQLCKCFLDLYTRA